MRKLVLQATLLLLIILGCVLLGAPSAKSAALLDGFAAGAGGTAARLQGPDSEFPAELEGAANASLSLSPHYSAVGGIAYGFTHSYIRWQAGARATVTDADNPNLDVFLGIVYRGGSETSVQPSEWAPDAGFAMVPFPQTFPNLAIGADASYGLKSSRLLTYLAVRYALPVGMWK